MKMSKEDLKEALALTRKFNASDIYDAALENDMSLDEVRSAILDKQGKDSKENKTPIAPVIGLSEKEQAQYSFVRAIELSAFPNDPRVAKRSGFEAECSRAYAEKANKADSDGIWVPADVMLTRDFNLTTGAGSNLVFTDGRPQNFIEILRNKILVTQLGAQVLENLVGPVAIPRQTGSVTAYWFNPESGAITSESNPTIDQVALTPRTLGAYTDISRRLLLGSSIGVESMVRNDIAETLGVAIDKAAYLGAGTNEPTGIFNTSGVGADTWDTANTPTWAEIVNCETQVDLGNALNGSFAYIMGASLRGACKTVAKVSGTSADFLIDRDGQMNGYPAYSTNQLGAGQLVFGKMSDLFIGMFSGLNIQTDPYLLATSGGIRVTALVDVDLAVRRPGSFYVMTNAVSS